MLNNKDLKSLALLGMASALAAGTCCASEAGNEMQYKCGCQGGDGLLRYNTRFGEEQMVLYKAGCQWGDSIVLDSQNGRRDNPSSI